MNSKKLLTERNGRVERMSRTDAAFLAAAVDRAARQAIRDAKLDRYAKKGRK